MKGPRLEPLCYVADRSAVADADALIRAHGEAAGFEAAMRADACRGVGNHIHYCRWRHIERLIALMSVDHAWGTVH